MPDPQPTPRAAQKPPTAAERVAQFRPEFNGLPRWARLSGLILASATGVLLITTIIGFSTSAFNFNMSAKHLANIRVLESDNAKLIETEARLNTNIKTAARLVDQAEDELRTGQEEIAQREADLAAAELAVAGREAAAGAAEAQKKKQEIRNGVHVIGTTIEPGVYQTAGSKDGCYYAWMTGTGSDADIVDNNITQGSATVTLVAGEIFESSMCAIWTKVG